MVTGFSVDQMYQQIDEAERSIRGTQEKLGRFREIQPKLRELVGNYDSEDGYIHVEWSAAGGLSVLEINPRALRMPSEDLADLIKTAVRTAQSNLHEQTRALMNEAGLGTGQLPDFEQVQAQLRAMGEQSIAANRRAADEVAQAQAMRKTLPF